MYICCMKKLTLFLLMFAVSSCGVYVLEKSDYRQIPKGVSKVVVYSNIKPDSAYSVVARSLIRDGFIINGNREFMQVSTNTRSVGFGVSMLTKVLIDPYRAGSKITYSGEWGMDSRGQIFLGAMTGINGNSSMTPITFFSYPSSKNDVAFQFLVIYATRITGTVSYEK